MPTYGYQCTQCKHEFSAFQAMKDAPLTACPECEGAVKRLLYPVGIVFKGSGWYVNDSRKPEKTSESASSDSAAKSDAPSDTKATIETKTATETKAATASGEK